MQPTDEPKGNVYAIVRIENSLTISLYGEDWQNVTPGEFIERYRKYFELDTSCVTQFEEPCENGCRFFVTNSGWLDELCTAGIFVPLDIDEKAARHEIAERFQMGVSNFDSAILQLEH